jgi:RHS repeat-associated protein
MLVFRDVLLEKLDSGEWTALELPRFSPAFVSCALRRSPTCNSPGSAGSAIRMRINCERGLTSSRIAHWQFGRKTGTAEIGPFVQLELINKPFQYTGREFDQETGLRFYRLRYFDPGVGRFISEDPIGFDGGVNFYRYVQNNVTDLIDPFGLSSLVFIRANGTLTLLDNNGNVVAVCTAANNATRSSNGPWPNGTYPFQSHNNHPPDPNGPYGSYGIDVFDVPGRTGMGTHSGRANSGGPNHPTLGCGRTTDGCMKTITDWQSHDPMRQITIQ